MSKDPQITKIKPLLSIVVPTKNRYEYLIPCLKSLLRLKSLYPEIEIVVQDNNEDNSPILDFIENNKKEIKYFHIKEHLSVVDNCEYAIGNSAGEYVALIGDDDSVADSIVDIAKWMKENTIDSCIGRIVRFNWPDMKFTVRKYPNLNIPEPVSDRIISAERQLEKVLNHGATAMFLLPKSYHALVSKEALNKAKELSGSYFPGPSPDMANAVALALSVEKHAIINTPFIISGFSYKSAGGAGTRRAHVAKIEETTHLPKDTAKKWDAKVPRIWTAETIYAESVLEALTNSDQPQLKKKFNYNALYGHYLVFHWELRNYLREYIDSKNIFPIIYQGILAVANRGHFFLKNVIFSKIRKRKYLKFNNVDSLERAVEIINKYNSDAKQIIPSLK